MQATRTDGRAETLHFGMTDSKLENAKLARALREQYPDAAVEVGTHGSEAYNMVEGISPDTLTVFAKFMNFLGDSVASALTNATQPVLQSLPYLEKWEGGSEGRRPLVRCCEHRPERRHQGSRLAGGAGAGDTAPHEPHLLYAEMIQGLGSNLASRKFQRAWGSFFSLGEQFNRRITYAAAWNTDKALSALDLRAAGVKDAYGFAVKAVAETQASQCPLYALACLVRGKPAVPRFVDRKD